MTNRSRRVNINLISRSRRHYFLLNLNILNRQRMSRAGTFTLNRKTRIRIIKGSNNSNRIRLTLIMTMRRINRTIVRLTRRRRRARKHTNIIRFPLRVRHLNRIFRANLRLNSITNIAIIRARRHTRRRFTTRFIIRLHRFASMTTITHRMQNSHHGSTKNHQATSLRGRVILFILRNVSSKE